MNFSRDEHEREAQHDLLKKLRSETKAASAVNAEESKRKKKLMDERLRKVRDKKRLKLGYPIIEPEDDPLKTPPLSDEEDGNLNKVTEPLVIASNAQTNVEDGISVNLRLIREWDLGKPSINREMSQEEWTESRRKIREKEFAPPKLYSDRIGRENYGQSKKSMQNRLKNYGNKDNEDVKKYHQNSIHNRLKYNSDSHISNPTVYPGQVGTSSSNDMKEFDRKNIANKNPCDLSTLTWSRNNEAEFHKLWGFKTTDADEELGSSGPNKDVENSNKTTNIDNYPETEKPVSQNTNSNCYTSHANYEKAAEYRKASDRAWDPSNKEVEFENSHLSERNSEVVNPDNEVNEIYLNKNCKDDRAYNASGKQSMDSYSQYDNKNISDNYYAPISKKRWSKWDHGHGSKSNLMYDSNAVSRSDCKNPSKDSMFNSDNGPVSLMDIPSPYDNSTSSNKTTVFNDYGKWNSTDNSMLGQTQWENRMRHGSSEYMGGWDPSNNSYCNRITGRNKEGGDWVLPSSQHGNASESGNSGEQTKMPEFQELVPNKVFDKAWSSTRNSRFNQGCGQNRNADEHSEFGSNMQGPNRNAENTESFGEPSQEKNTEYNESSQKPNVTEFDKFSNAEVGARFAQNINNRYWGPDKTIRRDYAHGKNVDKEFDRSWGSCVNSSSKMNVENKNENFEINSASSKNMGLNFEQAWTGNRSAEFDQTFNRFRNTSGDSDKKWSSNKKQLSEFNKPFDQKNITEYSPPATSSTFHCKPPSQQDYAAIERAISEGLMKLRKEFDNTPV